jgi:RHS repeat-associated protein
VSISHTKGQTTYSAFTYTLDPVGNPTRVVTPSETIDMIYDALDRLTQACYTPSCSGQVLSGISYAYDSVGNRVSETRYGTSGSSTITSTYDAADRLTQAGPTIYSYDDNGTQITAGSRTFAYDLQDRLISTTAGGATETYAYDGDGNRLALSVGGQVTTSYVWDPNAPLPELAIERDGAGALLRRYTYGSSIGQVPLAMRAAGSDHYLLGDALGSVADVVSSDGTAEWSYTYEPYGAMRAAVQESPSAPTNLLRFTGQLLDQTTSNYHLQARGYDPSTGRFLQLDPVNSPAEIPFSSAYAYVRGRPTVATDPSGLWCLIHNSDGGCLGAGVARRAWHVGRLALNAPVTAVGWAWAEGSSGGKAGCHWRTGLILECSRSAAWSNGPLGVLAVGNAVINEGDPLQVARLAHETRHADQWAILGPVGFIDTWLFSTGVSHITTGTYACGNFLEWWAGLEAGGYDCQTVGAIAK